MTLKDQTRRSLLGLAMLLASAPGLADLRLNEAEACTEEPNRLDRLACFDEVFATPWPATRVVSDSPR